MAVLFISTGAAWSAWHFHRDRLVLGAMAVAFFVAAAALSIDGQRRALNQAFGPHTSPIAVRLRLVEDASPRDGFTALQGTVLAVRVGGEWTPAAVGTTITVGGSVAAEQSGEWRAGRIIETFATFRRPARYFSEGVPDFERDLVLAGTAFFGSIKSGWLVDVRARGSAVQEAAAIIRDHVRRSIQRWVAPHDAVAAAIVTAVLIGDRTGLPDDIRLRLQAAGTYHVIAISGGNIAILAGLSLILLLMCGVTGRPAALLTIAALLAYAQVVTAGPSVWRATLMATIYLAARALDHRSPPWHAMAVTAALVLCVRPLEVRDVGFILTFGATAAILEGARRATRLVPQGRSTAWLVASLAASVAAEIALLPVSAWTFSRVTSAGLVLNLIAVPLMGIVQVAGMVTAAVDRVEAMARVSGWVAHAAASALVSSARLVD